MITLKKAFLKKYPKSGKVIDFFEKSVGKEFSWENLTKPNLSDFIEGMEAAGLSANTVRQYCARLKAVLSLYEEETELPKGYKDILSLKSQPVINTWLNEEDLLKLENYKAKTGNERQVQARFLIGAYIGARFSDFSQLDAHNVTNGMLSYVSKKTKRLTTVPVKPLVRKLLSSVIFSKDMPDATFNGILRRICQKSGINDVVKVFKGGKEMVGEKYMFVSSHTARRSFATNLYLRGADLYSISRMLGHSSVEMTAQNYICCGLRPQSEKVMEYFQ